MHIQKRGNTWFAYLNVPADVRDLIGKARFFQTTKTADKRLAEQRASALVQGWKIQINQARGVAADPFVAEALNLSGLMKTSPPQLVREIVVDEVLPRIERKYGQDLAEEFRKITSGETTALSPLLPAFREHETRRGLAPKTIDQALKDVEVLVSSLPTTSLLTPQLVTAWINTTAEENNLSASSVTRMVGFCRVFFRYLQSVGEVGNEIANPFVVPNAYRRSKKPNAKSINRSEPWQPFLPEDIELLYREAASDQPLQTLIKLGAYTGARIEELCSLKTSDVSLPQATITITESKTSAGVRTIPVHSELIPLVKKLVSESTDGYLISGLTFNMYGDRSNAIGKRFGRLKSRLEFPKCHVFHSIRKTVVTMLENAGVSENLAADIVGHDKPRITYGLYSGGATIQVMRTAIEHLRFSL